MVKDLEYYLAQARRISAHREADAEKEIRKLYKTMLKDLQDFVADAYVKYAQGDKLSFAMLQKAGYDARFLEEIEKHISVTGPRTTKALRKLVNDTYKLSYDGMVEAVTKGGNLDEAFADAISITPNQIKKIVQNPLMDIALEKNHKDILYDIKQVVAVGLMNGDRYTTMAHRIAEKVDGDYYKAIRIARTEAHRVREAGNHDAAVEVDKELQNGTTGMRMCKTWKTMNDERVRPQRRRRGKKGWSTKMGSGPNHMILEGQTVLAGEDFDLGHYEGKKVEAQAPGSTGIAGHDINCRCYVSYEMLTDAEYYAKTGKHFPGAVQTQKVYKLDDTIDDIDIDTLIKAYRQYSTDVGNNKEGTNRIIQKFKRNWKSGKYNGYTLDQIMDTWYISNPDRKQTFLNVLNKQTGAVKITKPVISAPVIKGMSSKSSKWAPEEVTKARKRISKRMKTDGQLNDRQYAEFETLMADWSDDQIMVYDAFTRTKLKKNKYHASGGAYYQPGADFVNMDINDNVKERHLGQTWTAGWHTKFHEEFHQIDYTLFKSAAWSPKLSNTVGTKAFKTAFESDIIKLMKEHTSFRGKTLAALTKNQTAISELARYLNVTYISRRQKAQINLFTDGLGLATKNAFSPHRYGFWGHDGNYNQRGMQQAAMEVWASYGGCIMSNDKEQREVLDNIMPETMKLMDSWFMQVVDDCH